MPRGTRIFGPVAREFAGKGLYAHRFPGAGGGVMKIKADDEVLVIAGKEKGKRGRVERHLLAEQRIVVDGVNVHYEAHQTQAGNTASGGAFR